MLFWSSNSASSQVRTAWLTGLLQSQKHFFSLLLTFSFHEAFLLIATLYKKMKKTTIGFIWVSTPLFSSTASIKPQLDPWLHNSAVHYTCKCMQTFFFSTSFPLILWINCAYVCHGLHTISYCCIRRRFLMQRNRSWLVSWTHTAGRVFLLEIEWRHRWSKVAVCVSIFASWLLHFSPPYEHAGKRMTNIWCFLAIQKCF